jgi:SAM-dependent methyltransferase
MTEPVTGLPGGLEAHMACPSCKSSLEMRSDGCFCMGTDCGLEFPLWRGVPVLFNEAQSLFSIAGVLSGADRPFATANAGLRQRLSRLAPTVHRNVIGRRNFLAFSRHVLDGCAAPRVLVIGSRVLGDGMEALTENPAIVVIESDVEAGPRPAVLFDAHDIPFIDATFDGVIVQAVLEHVADPTRVVSEIHRVLAPAGIVYAETPFMQQVHEGAYDYMRFTHLGHRRLFRDFAEIDSGIACGPGMALAWSWQYFLTSFARGRRSRTLAKGLARLTAWPLKYFDGYLARRPAAYDAASGFYFLGRRGDERLSDRELVTLYRGAM